MKSAMCASALFRMSGALGCGYPNLPTFKPGLVPGSLFRDQAMRRKIFIALTLLLPASAARSQTIDTPQCRADLTRAEALISEIASRDRAGPIRDPAERCRILRLNLSQMRIARDAMQRCMRGHAQRENVGQMDVSMEDIAAVIARRC